jgi:hypothetical protein
MLARPPRSGDARGMSRSLDSPEGRLNIGAVAEHGAFEVEYAQDDEATVTTSEQDAGLMFFLTRLYTRLQQLGTVGAVDLSEYARPLEA